MPFMAFIVGVAVADLMALHSFHRPAKQNNNKDTITYRPSSKVAEPTGNVSRVEELAKRAKTNNGANRKGQRGSGASAEVSTR